MDANTQVRLDGGHLCGGGSVRRACPEIRMGVAPAAPCQCHRGRMLPPTSELFSFPHGIGTLSRPVYFEDRKGRLSPELVWESSAAHPRASAVGFTGTQVRGESKHSKASLHAQRGHLCICSVGCIVVRIPGVVPRVYTRPFWRGQSLVGSGHLCCDIQPTRLQCCNVPEGWS